MKTIDYRRMQMQPGQRLLDIGCGEGRHAISAWLEYGVEAVGLDMQEDNLRTARQRMRDCETGEPGAYSEPGQPSQLSASGETSQSSQPNEFSQPSESGNAAAAAPLFINADARSLPFADASFDQVICSEVLEHIVDYHRVLREAVRVLRPGGTLALSVPTAWPERICWALDPTYAHAPGGHIRIFSHRRLRRETERVTGLRCRHQASAHALHTPYWWLRCLFYRDPEGSRLVQAWHRLLVRDLFRQVRWTRVLERPLNPLLGKSRTLYFQ